MFSSRFLKSSSYAVLSASIVSVAKNAGGFALIEANNEQKISRDSNGKNVLLPSKQQSPELGNVSSFDETKDELEEENKKEGRRIWPWVVFGIPAVIVLLYVGCIVYSYRPYFKHGTEKFRKLGLIEKVEKVRCLIACLDDLRKNITEYGCASMLFGFISLRYGPLFDLKEIFSLNGLNYECIKQQAKMVLKNDIMARSTINFLGELSK